MPSCPDEEASEAHFDEELSGNDNANRFILVHCVHGTTIIGKWRHGGGVRGE
jgi:hypothetical protein